MTDLRQGVTPTQHEVLDLIEGALGEEWRGAWDWERRIHVGYLEARRADTGSELINKRRHAIIAAALLIDAAEEIGRLIGAAAPEADQQIGAVQ